MDQVPPLCHDVGAGARVRPLVVLVNTNQIQPPIAPIAFDYLYEPLIQAGFQVDILDLCFAADYKEAIVRYCATHQVDFWGVTLRNTDDVYFASQQSFLDLVREMIAALKRQRNVPVTLGGVGFSIMPERILERCGADYGIVCEGEVAFPALLGCLRAGQPLDSVPNLVWRTDAGIVRNPVRYADLLTLPTHQRTLVDNERYFLHGGQAGIETKRGCNRRCIYCVEPLTKGQRLRFHSPAQVADQIQNLVERGIFAFHINDSEFNLSIQHPIAICDELIRRNLHRRIEWYAYGMPAPFPDHLASKMREAGCVGMNFGTDSASEVMLAVLQRTFTKEDIRSALKTCRRHGLRSLVELLFGAPGETAATIKETIEFMQEIDAESVSITAGLRVFPGTELERMVRAEGITPDNPNLFGAITDNEDLSKPLFYLRAAIADNPLEYIASLTRGDPRFFTVNAEILNYSTNQALIDAISAGARGAYWSILTEIDAVRRSAAAVREARACSPRGLQVVQLRLQSSEGGAPPSLASSAGTSSHRTTTGPPSTK